MQQRLRILSDTVTTTALGALRRATRTSLGRLGWSFGSQALSSATNFLLSVLVLRDNDLTAFGYFTLTMYGYILALNMARAMVGTPMLLTERARETPEGGLGLALTVGTALALFGSPLIFLLPAEHRHLGLVMALALPLTLLQDGQRFASFAQRKPNRAACLDGAWLIVMLSLAMAGGVEPVLAWAAGAAASAVLGTAVWGLRPALPLIGRFLAATRYWRGGLLAEAGGRLLILQVSPYLAAIVIGVTGFGALRAAYTVVAPIGLVVSGVAPILLLSYQERTRERPETLRTFVATNVAWLSGLSLTYVAIALVLPDHILVKAFGPAVINVAHLILPIGLTMVFLAAFCTIVDALRSLLAPRAVAVVRVIAACAEPTGVATGGALGGLDGAATGSAVGMFTALVGIVAVFLFAGCVPRPSIVEESEH